MKELFRKIHTERFRWYDEIVLVSLGSFLLVFFGQILGLIAESFIKRISPGDPFLETFTMYFSTIGVWVLIVLYLLIAKHRRPILKALGPKAKGNSFLYLLLGLAIGFGMNFGCAAVAMLKKDIHLSFAQFDLLKFLALLFAVFVQPSSEELADRAFLFQVLKKGYRNKWVALIGNALVFTALHGLNPGVTVTGLTSIFLSGLLFSLFVWYFDSLWCAFGIHTGWNFTQSILLGLPNSGLVVPYSIFMLDTANANDSFAYHTAFGIEGTLLSVIVLIIVCVITYLLGRKRNQQPLDVWIGFERKEKVKAEE